MRLLRVVLNGNNSQPVRRLAQRPLIMEPVTKWSNMPPSLCFSLTMVVTLVPIDMKRKQNVWMYLLRIFSFFFPYVSETMWWQHSVKARSGCWYALSWCPEVWTLRASIWSSTMTFLPRPWATSTVLVARVVLAAGAKLLLFGPWRTMPNSEGETLFSRRSVASVQDSS